MANIKVAVRVRPISAREIHLTGSEIVVHTEPKTVSLTNLKVSSNKAGDSRERTRIYGFDYCFDSSDSTSENYASQETIYETLGGIILDALFKRYNSCLVAYGQSSSGKTYTMMGSKEDPGLTPRVCEGLFLRLADEDKSNGSFHVAVSYLEVYNERVRDLLNPSSNCVGLRVREHPRLGPYVQGLTHHAVSTLGSLISRVEEGTRARKTASTLQNPTSSRSHALLTLSLLPTSDNSGQPVGVPGRNDFSRGSKLHLVDLAGSESAAACGGVNRQKEGANINKSLVALGNVISALADRGPVRSSPGRRFIPYRDSALTWLLKDVLGGNATTIMLATISPASGSYNETSHTLRFAQRAQSVINRPVINEDPVSRIIRELRAEVARLKSLLNEKNINTAVNSTSVAPCVRDPLPEVDNSNPDIRDITSVEQEEERVGTSEVDDSTILENKYSPTDSPIKESTTFVETSGYLEESKKSSDPSNDLDSGKYNEAEVSEFFVSDEIDGPVYVDIPTLVAVLIKPEANVPVDSHQIEEISNDGHLEDLNDVEFSVSPDRRVLIRSNSSTNCLITRRQSDDYTSSVIEDRDPFPPHSEESLDTLSRQREKTKLRKQDSIDIDFPLKNRSTLNTVKKCASIESLPRKTETIGTIDTTHQNLEPRNDTSDKIKKLNDIKEIGDTKNGKSRNSLKNVGPWSVRDLQKRGSIDSEKSLKLFGSKSRGKSKKSVNNGLSRKASKDSSSSSSKDELLTSPNHRPSPKGILLEEPISTRVHTPIQRSSRAEIVTAVTERLYSSKKPADDVNAASTITSTSTPVSESRSPESTDVKLAAATRMRLQEISRKMLAKRRKISVDTQTDNEKTVRVRDTASLTEIPEIISKDASVLTDRHEDYETLISTNFSVVRVKETSTITDSHHRDTVVRCKDVGIITDNYYNDYSTIESSRNDSGIMSDDGPNYSRSDLSSVVDASDLIGNVDRRSVESVDNSTNTRMPSGPSDCGSQTRRQEFVETRCGRCCETRCCGRTDHCHEFNRQNQSVRRNEKNVISISLPDMISITIESSNGLESKIKVIEGDESSDDQTNITSKDNQVQTDVAHAVEMATSTDDIFGRIRLDDISVITKPFVPQTDGKTFRIENIFHNNGDAVGIKPTIEIVSASSINDAGRNSLTVTNSIGTIFAPETRENATGMDKLTNFRFNKRFGKVSGETKMARDSIVENTWPGQWRRRMANSRRKPDHPASNDDKFPSLKILRDHNTSYQCPFEFNQNKLAHDKTGSQRVEPETRQVEKLASMISEAEGLIVNSRSPCVSTKVASGGAEQETNFSDDSLDSMQDGAGAKIWDNDNVVIKWNPINTDSMETKVSDKICPPDVVAHTKKDNDDTTVVSNIAMDCDDFEDTQQIVFPKVKVETAVPTSFATPMSDLKSLILGDSCYAVNKAEELNSGNVDDTLSVNVFRQDATIRCPIDDSGFGLKSIMKKPMEKNENTRMSDQDQLIRCGSDNLASKCRCAKKVHFAVPEVFELTSSDSENVETSTSEDETSQEHERQHMFDDYLDEAVILMRSMNSMNEYMSVAREFDKMANDDRNRRRGKFRGSNYIEYNGRRINLDDDTDADEVDEDLDLNVESYDKCVRSMARLENCLAKIRSHDEILRDNFGIRLGGSTGAKQDLAKSSVDSRVSKEGHEGLDVEFSRTTKQSKGKKISRIIENVDGENNNENPDENGAKYFRGNENENRAEIFEYSEPHGFWKFFDTRPKDMNDSFKFHGKINDFEVFTKTKKMENISGPDGKIVKSMEINGSGSEENRRQNSNCYSTLDETKRVVTSPFDGIKSSGFRPQFSVFKYDCSNASSSSNEALETFVECADDATRSGDKFKYPGSPRSKFLQLLSERRRIVENTRNTGVS